MATFTASGWETDSTDLMLFPPAPVQARIDPIAHTFSVSLLATDNTGPLPTGWTWTVTFSGIPGIPAYSFSFFLAYANGATQDISTLAPVVPSTPMAAYMPNPLGTAPPAGWFPIATGAGFVTQWGTVAGTTIVTLVDGSTIPLAASAGNLFRLTLTGSGHVLQNPTGAFDGQLWRVEVTQDATGGRTLAYGTAYEFGTITGGVAPVLSTSPAITDVIGFQWDNNAGKARCIAFAPNYS